MRVKRSSCVTAPKDGRRAGSGIGTCGTCGAAGQLLEARFFAGVWQPNRGQVGVLRTDMDVGSASGKRNRWLEVQGEGDGGHARGRFPGMGLGVGGGGW